MKSNPVQHYLVEVLGVKSFVRPKDLEALRAANVEVSETQAELSGDSEASVGVLVDRPLVPAESALLERMLDAIDVRQHLLLQTSLDQACEALGQFKGTHVICFSAEMAETVDASQFRVWQLPDMASMIEGPADQVQANKKRAWGLLQELKKAGHS